MIIYLIGVHPFIESSQNIIHIYNEFVILFSFVAILSLNLYQTNQSTTEFIGIIILILILISLIYTRISIVPDIYQDICNMLKKKKDAPNGK